MKSTIEMDVRKGKELEGVGTSSLMSLQAEVLKAQNRTGRERKCSGSIPKKKLSKLDNSLLNSHNRGVLARDAADRLNSSVITDKPKRSKEMLEIKTKLYDTLSKSGYVAELYQVDFPQKPGDLSYREELEDQHRHLYDQKVAHSVLAERKVLDKVQALRHVIEETNHGQQANAYMQNQKTKRKNLIKDDFLRRKLSMKKQCKQ